MLVLTRKRLETIQIGDDVLVKVIETGRHSVKIGIQAPDHVRVVRSELLPIPGPQFPLAAFLKERRANRADRTPANARPGDEPTASTIAGRG